MKKIDVTALGEILIDFTYAGTNADGKKIYEENPGGAPANCVCAATKLGANGAFIGMTGCDSFGYDVRKTLQEIGVDTGAMRYTQKQHTTLAFVSLDEKGERTFSFCRNPGADTQLMTADLDETVLQNTRILHVGSLSLTDEPARSATFAAIRMVQSAGGLVSYDPNYREALWNGRNDAVAEMKSLLPYADIVKVSEEELPMLLGQGITVEQGASQLLAGGASVVFITLGARGVHYAARTASGERIFGSVGSPEVTVVDTTGAGDSFTGGILYRFTRREKPLDFTKAELESDLVFANAVASLCVTKRGAIPALPSLAETEAFMKTHML
ncbi:MAG: carbohydrate kinase [Treponema sp.]|nr:carbohydrate kinase [Treponema sp.]